ncbi:hypothetical protein [Mangrovicella endophytica]|uniref:hypothetical protein n=1 Tax=Mangrovicella endophytica TaxID=2066697 RepID=UPI0012FFE62B|nr:hypothetical protein [Mangrovicella endophytica]
MTTERDQMNGGLAGPVAAVEQPSPSPTLRFGGGVTPDASVAYPAGGPAAESPIAYGDSANDLSEAAIDAILNDPDMPFEQRQAQLQELGRRLAEQQHLERGSEYEPLGTKLQDALAMLAEGGHLYGADLSEDDADASATDRDTTDAAGEYRRER